MIYLPSLSKLAAITGGGVNYSWVKEVSEDAIVEYYYNGDNNDPQYYGHRVLIEYDPTNVWAPYHTDYSDYYNEWHPDFCYNYICPDYKHGQLIRKK